jgi:hypothetical protein
MGGGMHLWPRYQYRLLPWAWSGMPCTTWGWSHHLCPTLAGWGACWAFCRPYIHSPNPSYAVFGVVSCGGMQVVTVVGPVGLWPERYYRLAAAAGLTAKDSATALARRAVHFGALVVYDDGIHTYRQYTSATLKLIQLNVCVRWGWPVQTSC